MESIYSERFDIPCYMCDVSSRLRPSSFMDIAQELSAKGLEQIACTDQEISRYNLVWILSRMSVRFPKVPCRLDSLTAQTWHRGLDGLFFLRDCRLIDAEGRPAAVSTSSWIVMDRTTRKAVRSDHLTDIIPSAAQSSEAVMDTAPQKLLFPKGAEAVEAGERQVLYSDLDYNGHVNNAKYVMWAFDALPLTFCAGTGASEFDINFNREARPGETVRMHYAVSGPYYYVEGMIGSERSFILRCR